MAMSLEDFIRQALVVRNGGSITIIHLNNGRYQVNVQRGRTNAFGSEIGDDPVDTLWNVLVPFNMRRVGSGPPFQPPITNPPIVEVTSPTVDLDELLGDVPAADPLGDLFG